MASPLTLRKAAGGSALRSSTAETLRGAGGVPLTRTLTGTQPAATGGLTRKLQALRALTGAQPAASGSLTRKLQAKRTLAGAQPSATGTLTRVLGADRALTGIQPAATGALARILHALRTLTGTQPAASGALMRKLQAKRIIAGVQPSASGILSARLVSQRSITGTQPASTGALTRILRAFRSLTGTQPAATGGLTTVATPFEVTPPAPQPVVPWYPLVLPRRREARGEVVLLLDVRAYAHVSGTASGSIMLQWQSGTQVVKYTTMGGAVGIKVQTTACGRVLLSPEELEEQEEFLLLGL